MTKHVETIAPDTPIQEAVNRMRSLDVGVLPVSTGDRLPFSCQPNSTTTCFPNSGEKWALKDFLKGVA